MFFIVFWWFWLSIMTMLVGLLVTQYIRVAIAWVNDRKQPEMYFSMFLKWALDKDEDHVLFDDWVLYHAVIAVGFIASLLLAMVWPLTLIVGFVAGLLVLVRQYIRNNKENNNE